MLKTLVSNTYEVEARYDIPRGSNFKPPINERKGTIGNSNFPEVLQIKLGSRVMLIYNVDIPDLLVNGALGTVVGIECDKRGKIECIVVSFDKPGTGINQMKSIVQMNVRFGLMGWLVAYSTQFGN